MARALPSKLIGETITVEFNFADVLQWAETISSQVISVEVLAGLDDSPEDIISGVSSASGSIVSQDFTGGLGGVIYTLVATVTGSSGATYVKTRKLAILTDDSSFRPGQTLALTGSLPDGTAGVAYSAPLSINGGYPPYEWDAVVAGTAPFWMGFSVSGDELICAGTPDEDVETTYLFTPQVLDSANNTALAAQEITIFHLLINGDVEDGYVGKVVTGTYTDTYGVDPVAYSVHTGTFPAGLTLNADGTYTGTMTTAGTYSWQVKGLDSASNIAYLDDTCTVREAVWLTLYNASSFERAATGSYALAWGSSNPTTPGLGYFVNSVVYAGRLSAGNSVYKSVDYGVNWTYLGTTGAVSAGGGRLLFTDSYIFLCGGVELLKRYDGAAWGAPSADTRSRANSITQISNKIIVASIYKATVSRSSDDGATWVDGLAAFTSGNTGAPLLLAVGTTLYILRSTGLAVTEVLSSSDDGDSWTSVYTFPDSGSSTYEPADIVYTGTSIIVSQRGSGKVAYKLDSGGGWQTSASVLAGVNQFAVGDDKVLAGCIDGSIYESTDDGATWALATSPAGATYIHGLVWIYP